MADRLRVLFVNPGLGLGGAEHSLLLLLQALRSRGIECIVAVFGDGPFRERVIDLGFPTTTLRVPAVVRHATRYSVPTPGVMAGLAAGVPAALRLAALLRREAVDLVHTNGLKAHLLGGLAGSMSGVPVVWHVRDFPPPGVAGRLFRQAARWLPSAVLTNSRAVAKELSLPGPPAVRAVTVPNAVDLERFRDDLPREEIRRGLGLNCRVPVVGLVAHLTPWKGHDLFLAIARCVLERIPDARFVIAGGAIYETSGHETYEETLRRRAAALGLADRVTWLGAREDVASILAMLDVLVHCPVAPEPFGRVLAEAMAVGRPVVAARSGGIPEVVDHGVTGFLVPPGDASAFGEAVVRLLEDPALRARLGRAGRQRAEEMFRVDTHANLVVAAYQSVARSNWKAA